MNKPAHVIPLTDIVDTYVSGKEDMTSISTDVVAAYVAMAILKGLKLGSACTVLLAKPATRYTPPISYSLRFYGDCEGQTIDHQIAKIPHIKTSVKKIMATYNTDALRKSLAAWFEKRAKADSDKLPKVAGENENLVDKHAQDLANLMAKEYGHSPDVSDYHRNIARAIINKDAYALQHLANGMNNASKKFFTKVTGVKLPAQQGKTWEAIRDWGGVSATHDALREADRKVRVELEALRTVFDEQTLKTTTDWLRDRTAEGFLTLKQIGGKWFFLNDANQGYNLSQRGTGRTKLRPLIAAYIAYYQAKKADEEAQAAA